MTKYPRPRRKLITRGAPESKVEDPEDARRVRETARFSWHLHNCVASGLDALPFDTVIKLLRESIAYVKAEKRWYFDEHLDKAADDK